MCEKTQRPAKKATLSACVVFNQPVGEQFYKIRLRFDKADSEIIAQTLPGQFGEVKVENLSSPENLYYADKGIILRRPFSFCDVDKADDGSFFADILYCVIGQGTARMATLSENDSVSIIAPLGQGFNIATGKTTVLLLAGGIGVPPLQFLAKNISQNHPDIKMTAFIGAKTVKALPFPSISKSKQGTLKITEFAQFGVETLVSTDDGSSGFKGLITELLEEWLEKEKPTPKDTVIYTCGPEVMMAAAARLADKWDVECQVSMERLMACGIGLCQSCAVECKIADSQQTVYKLCCKDGPVFNSKEIIW